VNALGERFLFTVPAWTPESEKMDNWRTSAWEKASTGARGRSESDVHRDITD